MSDDKTDKKPPATKHEGQRVAFLRFVSDLPVAGEQISHAECRNEPAPTNKSYTCSYHGNLGMYELRSYLNGAYAKTFWMPRERVAYHEVLQ